VDVVLTMLASPDLADNILPNHLDTFFSSPSCSLPYPSPECCSMLSVDHHDMFKGDGFDYVESLGTLRRYDSSLDPYSLYQRNVPMKILFIVAFNHYTNVSKACDRFRREFTIIS